MPKISISLSNKERLDQLKAGVCEQGMRHAYYRRCGCAVVVASRRPRIKRLMLRMNAKDFRSKFTIAMSAEHTTPLPSAPAAQCSIDPPGKCPPPWINVTPLSSSKSLTLPQNSRCRGPAASPTWHRWHGDGRGHAQTHGSSRLASCRSADANRNGVQSAKPVDQGDRGVIDQRDPIPQDIPLRCAKEQSALADREPGLRANSYEPRLVSANPLWCEILSRSSVVHDWPSGGIY